MRICIDVSPVIRNTAGIGRYAKELVTALIRLDTGEDIRFFYTDVEGSTPEPPLDVIPRRILRCPKKVWAAGVLLGSIFRFPMDRLFGDIDIYHATDHLLPTLKKTRSIYTLYDLTFSLNPRTHLPLLRWSSDFLVPRSLKRCDRIIAISECTKRDAVRLYGIEADKIKVIPLGVSERFRPSTDGEKSAFRERFRLPERYLLYVGTIEPRKNLSMLLEAYRAVVDAGANVRLVIAGKKGWLYEDFFRKVRELHLEDEVLIPGFVPEEDLPALYSLADAFVYPSLYEGFGLPVLEAMACGTPVVCSNTSSLPEVAGNAGLLIPPTEPHAWAQALGQVTRNTELRAELRDSGLRQAGRFRWEKTARETLEVYRSVISGPGGRP